MNINRIVAGMFLCTFLVSQNMLNGMFGKAGKIGFVLAGLYAAGQSYDKRYGKYLEFVDVSVPSNPRIVGQVLNSNDDKLVKSVTMQQLTNDVYLTNGPVFYAKSGLSRKYADIVDAVLFSHFWVFLPTLRQKLTNFVLHLSCDEVEQRAKNRLCFVHGTNQGINILVNTIFDEVFNERLHQNFVKLRSDSHVNALEKYSDVHQYYDEQYPLAPRHELTLRSSPGGVKVSMGEQVLFDKGIAGSDTLSTNFGFFGRSGWFTRKDSSAEFITESCSWGYQIISSMISLLFLMTKNPAGFVSFITDVVKNPKQITNVHVLLDKKSKGYNDRIFLQDTFRSYGLERYYDRYDKELQSMADVVNAGLVHLSIKEEQAKRYSYISRTLGIRVSSNPEDISAIESTNTQDLPSYQARVIMHSQICNSENTMMRFYLLGKPEKVNNTIERIYEIAREIRSERQGQIIKQGTEQRQTFIE